MKRALGQSTKTAPKKRHQVRAFVFTLNNYTKADETAIAQTCKDLNLRWLIYGHEVAPTTGTPHLQGACSIGKVVDFEKINTWKGFERAYIAQMEGSPQQNLTYCTKVDPHGMFQWGTIPEPGKRTDLINCVEKLKENQNLVELVQDTSFAVCYVKYTRGINALTDLYRKQNDRIPPKIVWLWGKTGAGKTRSALELGRIIFGNEGVWLSNTNHQWFNGYNGQQCAILDEIRYNNIKFDILIRLLDRYPFRVETKGGYVPWVPLLIFVTSLHKPIDANFPIHEPIEQLERRIHATIEVPDDLSVLQRLLPEWFPEQLPSLSDSASDSSSQDGEPDGQDTKPYIRDGRRPGPEQDESIAPLGSAGFPIDVKSSESGEEEDSDLTNL